MGLALSTSIYADIANVSYPTDIMLIERLEYGDAIGMPVALQIKGEGTIPATDAGLQRGSRAW